MKVSEMPYVRPNKDEIVAQLEQMTKAFEKATSADEQFEILKQYCACSEDLATTMTLAFIRFTQNTADEFYVKEKDFADEVGPTLGFYDTKFQEAIYNSKFREELEKQFGSVFFEKIKLRTEVNDERLIPVQAEENKVISDYTKLMSNLVVDFNGEQLPPSGIAKYATNPDRSLRKGAYTALGKVYMEHAAELDDLFDKLVKNRTEQGKMLGYENYCPIAYANMQRTCFDKDDIAAFRANVKKYFVPLAVKIEERVKKDLGIDKITFYDSSLFTKEEAKPIGTPEEIFANGQKMYDEMCEDTGKLFRNMNEIGAFDALSRKGKWGGGYMTALPKYKTPFILSNFNGSCDDIGVLTHEFGHSFEGSKEFELPYGALYALTMEEAEIHSMSMEFLTYPWMELFFGDKTPIYKFNHIASALTFIPYGTIVDCFQQRVYDNPDMTPAERNGMWAALEKEFLPYMDNTGIPFYGEGRRWQRQAHIFESPFYYIDYCLAQFTAFQFLALAEKNHDEALAKYMKLVSYGPTESFTDLLEKCGLKSPFVEDSFKDIVATVEKLLNL